MRHNLVITLFVCFSFLSACKKAGTSTKEEVTPPPAKAAVISTIAGNGTTGFSGDNSNATLAQLFDNRSVAVDAAGNVYIGDRGNGRIRKVSTTGIITTIAGNGSSSNSGDGGPATSAGLAALGGIVVDASGNIFLACSDVIRKINTNGIITRIAGSGVFSLNTGDGGLATSANLSAGLGFTVDRTGNIFIADWGNHRVRKVNSTTGIITTIAGNGTPQFITLDKVTATSVAVPYPGSLAIDANGKLYITSHNRVLVLDNNGIINTLVGTGDYGFSGDGGLAINATIWPGSIAFDKNDNLFIADYGNGVVRKVSSGIISTIVGGGRVLGDGGPPLEATLIYPTGIALDGAGNIFIADYGSRRIRKVTYP